MEETQSMQSQLRACASQSSTTFRNWLDLVLCSIFQSGQKSVCGRRVPENTNICIEYSATAETSNWLIAWSLGHYGIVSAGNIMAGGGGGSAACSTWMMDWIDEALRRLIKTKLMWFPSSWGLGDSQWLCLYRPLPCGGSCWLHSHLASYYCSFMKTGGWTVGGGQVGGGCYSARTEIKVVFKKDLSCDYSDSFPNSQSYCSTGSSGKSQSFLQNSVWSSMKPKHWQVQRKPCAGDTGRSQQLSVGKLGGFSIMCGFLQNQSESDSFDIIL